MPFWITVLCLLWLSSGPAIAEQAMSELQLRVQVQGAVRRPGVYRVPSGSRPAELLARAGGPRTDARLQGLNLARRLADGELCYVPSVKEATPAPEALIAAPTARRAGRRAERPLARPRPAGKINLNAATAAQLDTLPGVGPSMVAAILRVRGRLGRFRSVEDLREVPGVGPKRFERLRPLVEAP